MDAPWTRHPSRTGACARPSHRCRAHHYECFLFCTVDPVSRTPEGFRRPAAKGWCPTCPEPDPRIRRSSAARRSSCCVPGRTPRELAESLGVSQQTLRNWRRQDQLDRHERDDGLTTDERDELRAAAARERAAAAGARSAQASRGLLRDGERDPVSGLPVRSRRRRPAPRSPWPASCSASRRSGFYAWAGRAPSDRALSRRVADRAHQADPRARTAASTARRASTPSCASATASRSSRKRVRAPDAPGRPVRAGRAASAAARRSACPASASPTTSSSGASGPTAPNGCGSPTSPTCAPGRAGSTSPPSRTPTAAGSSAGRWPTTCAPSSSSTRCRWRSRRRRPAPGLIHHSDQGSQFVSLAFGQKARDAGIAVSMGSKGDCLRQRRRRELLRHAQEGTRPPPLLADPPRAASPRSSSTSKSSTTPPAGTRRSATSHPPSSRP